MALFMPSEIARLVLGYLKESGCVETTTIYMKENPHLGEYVSCLKQGYEYPTTIGGKTLLDLLNELSSLRTGGQNARNDDKNEEIKEFFTRIEEGIADLKHLVTVRPNEIERNSGTRIQVQKTTDRILNMISETNEKSPKKVTSSVNGCLSGDTSTPVGLNGPEALSVEVNTSSEADVPTTSTPRSGSSMLCSSRSFLCTPTSRPPTIYSSPSSIARSAVIFSLGIDFLKTPMKDRCLAEDGSLKSPRRKSQLPRKRLSYSPFPSAKKNRLETIKAISPAKPEVQPSNDDNVDVSVLIGQLLTDKALQERIAENINRIVSSSNQPDSSSSQKLVSNQSTEDHEAAPKDSETQSLEPEVMETGMPDNILKDIINQTELDPLYEAFLSSFIEKNEHLHETVESDNFPSPDSHGTPLSQVFTTPTLTRSFVTKDSSPCCISENVHPSSVSKFTESTENTPVAGVSSYGVDVTPVDCTLVLDISPSKGCEPVIETDHMSVVENSPKRTVSTKSPCRKKRILDLFQHTSNVRIEPKVVEPPLQSVPIKEGIQFAPEQIVTYALLDPATIGTVVDLSTTNKTAVFMHDVQPQGSGSFSQSVNVLPTQSNFQIMTLYPEQLFPLVSNNNNDTNQNETSETVEAIKEYLEKQQKKRRSLRITPKRPNQRFRPNEDRYQKQNIPVESGKKEQITAGEPKRNSRPLFNPVPLQFSVPNTSPISILKTSSERPSVITQQTSKVTDNRTKLTSLLTTAKTFTPLNTNTNSKHVRVLSFNSTANDSTKSLSSSSLDKNESRSKGKAKDVVTTVSADTCKTTLKPVKSLLKNSETKVGKPVNVNVKAAFVRKKPEKQNVQKEKDGKSTTTVRDSSELDVGYFLSRLRYAE